MKAMNAISDGREISIEAMIVTLYTFSPTHINLRYLETSCGACLAIQRYKDLNDIYYIMEEQLKILKERLTVYETKLKMYEHTTNEYLTELNKMHAEVSEINKEIQQILTMLDEETR